MNQNPRRAVVTGASTGIGEATVRQLRVLVRRTSLLI